MTKESRSLVIGQEYWVDKIEGSPGKFGVFKGFDGAYAVFQNRHESDPFYVDVGRVETDGRHDAVNDPPPCKDGWKHSDQVLVYYPAMPEHDLVDRWSIAYYLYEPPFKNKPEWVDFNVDRGTPLYWWPLPKL